MPEPTAPPPTARRDRFSLFGNGYRTQPLRTGNLRDEIDRMFNLFTRFPAEGLSLSDPRGWMEPFPVLDMADIATDPHYAARGMLQAVQMDDGSELVVPGFVPKLSETPGGHRRNAPALGQDTDAVLREVGLSDEQIDALRQRGIVA